MSLTQAKVEKEKKQLSLPKKGARVAVLSGIIDIGTHTSEFKGKAKPPKREFIPLFTLLNDKYEDDDGVEHQHTVRMYPIKLMPGAEKATYFGFYNALDPNHEKLDAKGQGNLFELIGNNCFTNMVHTEPDEEGIVFANCTGISAFPEDFPVPEVAWEKVIFDLDNPDRELFEGFSDWVKNKIRTSIGYAGSPAEKILEGEGPAGDDQEQQDAPDPEGEDSPI